MVWWKHHRHDNVRVWSITSLRQPRISPTIHGIYSAKGRQQLSCYIAPFTTRISPGIHLHARCCRARVLLEHNGGRSDNTGSSKHSHETCMRTCSELWTYQYCFMMSRISENGLVACRSSRNSSSCGETPAWWYQTSREILIWRRYATYIGDRGSRLLGKINM